MISIRNAEMKDFAEIQRIYAYARKFMAETGNPTQWGTEYPAESLLRKDIELGRLYVVEGKVQSHEMPENEKPCKVSGDEKFCETQENEKLHRSAKNGQQGNEADRTRLRGVFMFAVGEDPTYLQIEDGGWLSDTEYGVIHRIAGDGEIHGLLQLAVGYCEQKIHHLRIDTHADNKIMQHTILKNGFTRCGIVHMEDGTPRIAYERL